MRLGMATSLTPDSRRLPSTSVKESLNQLLGCVALAQLLQPLNGEREMQDEH